MRGATGGPVHAEVLSELPSAIVCGFSYPPGSEQFMLMFPLERTDATHPPPNGYASGQCNDCHRAEGKCLR